MQQLVEAINIDGRQCIAARSALLGRLVDAPVQRADVKR